MMAASLGFVWLKQLDVLAVFASLALADWCAHNVCDLKWRGSRKETLSRSSYPAPPKSIEGCRILLAYLIKSINIISLTNHP